jgi:hypothetical protein
VTNADTLLTLISQHPEGLDDDEISDKTGIKPRQQVYYICTRLAAEGRIRRVSVQAPGKRRKIHNFPAGATLPPASVPQSSPVTTEDASWRKRLSMLVAATGREDVELLDEALLDLARKLLRQDVLDKKPAKRNSENKS